MQLGSQVFRTSYNTVKHLSKICVNCSRANLSPKFLPQVCNTIVNHYSKFEAKFCTKKVTTNELPKAKCSYYAQNFHIKHMTFTIYNFFIILNFVVPF